MVKNAKFFSREKKKKMELVTGDSNKRTNKHVFIMFVVYMFSYENYKRITLNMEAKTRTTEAVMTEAEEEEVESLQSGSSSGTS